jgi:excisionase family DNA binding protein
MERIALTVPEMAKSLGIGVNKAYDLLHIEGFPCIRVGGKYIIPIEPLKKWMECAAGKEEPHV